MSFSICLKHAIFFHRTRLASSPSWKDGRSDFERSCDDPGWMFSFDFTGVLGQGSLNYPFWEGSNNANLWWFWGIVVLIHSGCFDIPENYRETSRCFHGFPVFLRPTGCLCTRWIKSHMHPWKVTAGCHKLPFFWQRKEKNMEVNHPSTSNFGFKMSICLWICWYLYIYFLWESYRLYPPGKDHISPYIPYSSFWGGDFWVDDLNTTSPGKNRPSRS